MGNNKWQTRSLIYRKDNKYTPWAYDLSIDMTNLKIVNMTGLAWALFVTNNRHPENFIEVREFTDWMSHLYENTDIIKGPIADDRLVPVINMFFGKTCTLEALTIALSECSLGTQYAAKTELACSKISVIKEIEIKKDRKIEENARNFYLKGEEAYKKASFSENRRKGRYLDELIAEIKDNINQINELNSCFKP